MRNGKQQRLDVYESNKVNERSQVPCAMNDNERGEKDDSSLSPLRVSGLKKCSFLYISPLISHTFLTDFTDFSFADLDLRAFGVT